MRKGIRFTVRVLVIRVQLGPENLWLYCVSLWHGKRTSGTILEIQIQKYFMLPELILNLNRFEFTSFFQPLHSVQILYVALRILAIS